MCLLESASQKCDLLLMYVYSTNSAIADYCYRRHAEQSKKWKEKWQKFHLTESSACLLQNLFLIHHREFWPSSRCPSTVTISLFSNPFEVELHCLANTAEPANRSREIPEAKLMFPLLRHGYQCIRPSRDYTHPANSSYSLRGCHNRLFMPALHNFATVVCKSYAPLKTERRLFLHYEQSCRLLIMTECVELHKYHKVMPCASYRNRDHYCL